MTESLYRTTLAYIRNHPHLINFTVLNYPIINDIIEIIKYENHLSEVATCRIVYNWGALYSYLAKYHSDSKFLTCVKKSFFGNALDLSESHIDGFYSTSEGIYELSTDSLYQICIFGEGIYRKKISNNRLIEKLSYEFSKVDNKDHNQASYLFMQDRRNMDSFKNTVCDIKLFKSCPDLLKWAVENNHISGKLFIYRDLLTNLN